MTSIKRMTVLDLVCPLSPRPPARPPARPPTVHLPTSLRPLTPPPLLLLPFPPPGPLNPPSFTLSPPILFLQSQRPPPTSCFICQ